MIIKIIIITVAIGLLLYGLSGRRTHGGRAQKKIGLLLLTIAVIVAVLFPETTNSVAHLVGVGRGADLLLYALTLAFIAYILNSYLHVQDDKDALFRLARKIAILEANERHLIDKSRSD